MFNKNFELTPDDIELIESALRQRQGSVIHRDQHSREAGSYGNPESFEEARKIQNLLGRLHHQKIWYQPKKFVPRG